MVNIFTLKQSILKTLRFAIGAHAVALIILLAVGATHIQDGLSFTLVGVPTAVTGVLMLVLFGTYKGVRDAA